MTRIDPLGLREANNEFTESGTIRIPSYSIEALRSNSDKFQTSIMATGIVTWEVSQIVAQDALKVVVFEHLPLTHAGGYAFGLSVNTIEATYNLVDFRNVGERVGTRIDSLYGR